MTDISAVWDEARQARREADRANASMTAHEKLCAERYRTIHGTMDDIKSILKWAAGGLIGVLCVIAWAFLRQSLHLP